MNSITLQSGCWYAMECIFSDGGRHYSPVWIRSVIPESKGNRRLDIWFYHANYPEGVRDKVYHLRVLRRTAGYLLAEENDQPTDDVRLILLQQIAAEWLRRHFPDLGIDASGDLGAQLDRVTARTP
jgi:hypothetical protein